MGESTAIAWTDHTFNPWIGCFKVAPECAACYAESMSNRFNWAKWGKTGTRRVASEDTWSKPEKWNEAAEKEGVRRRVFCASLADVFEDWQGPMVGANGETLYEVDRRFVSLKPGQFFLADRHPINMADVRRRLFALIDATPWLDWLLLTKRPGHIISKWPMTPGIPSTLIEFDGSGKVVGFKSHDRTTQLMYRPNVWLGTSAGTQESADRFIPEMLKCRDLAPVLFVSCEPMLDAVDLFDAALKTPLSVPKNNLRIDWVIVGCESNGPKVGRLGEFTTEAAWIKHMSQLSRQCEDAGVAFFLKQWPDEGRVCHVSQGFPQEFPQ